jgi:hypothetical protein
LERLGRRAERRDTEGNRRHKPDYYRSPDSRNPSLVSTHRPNQRRSGNQYSTASVRIMRCVGSMGPSCAYGSEHLAPHGQPLTYGLESRRTLDPGRHCRRLRRNPVVSGARNVPSAIRGPYHAGDCQVSEELTVSEADIDGTPAHHMCGDCGSPELVGRESCVTNLLLCCSWRDTSHAPSRSVINAAVD